MISSTTSQSARDLVPVPGQCSQQKLVVTCGAERRPEGHENLTQAALARRVATLLDGEFGGDYRPAERYDRHCVPLYFVPADTLTFASARQLGIADEHDLFGGVVPHPFVATKAITHGLVAPDATAPAGWSHYFSEMTADLVLPGYSAFTLDDARTAGRRVLEQGAVRLKRPSGVGGSGQTVATDLEQLDRQLASLDQAELLRDGIVCELNLEEVQTFSVGQVRLGDLLITYYGKQQATPNNHGAPVYGGSELVVVRGDFDAMQPLELSSPMRLAISQACRYHSAVGAAYPGMFASRWNYDVAQGADQRGALHCGVLEQSWRMGGASGAEIAALEAFRARSDLNVVRASTTERYGAAHAAPAGATVYFQGVDPKVGALLKYSELGPYAYP